MPAADDRLGRLLGGDDLAWLRNRVRDAASAGRDLPDRVSLNEPTSAQRRAVSVLLGRRLSTGVRLSVRLADVDAVIRRAKVCDDGLLKAIEMLDGPIPNLPALRADEARRWSAALAELDGVIDERLASWREELERSGRLRVMCATPERAAPMLRRLAAVLAALPADGEPVGVFASRVLRSAHALDDGPLATLAVGAIAATYAVPAAEPGMTASTWRRVAWAAAGLLRDELSTRVLVLGLRASGSSATARILSVGAETGQPVVLTLRQLVGDAYAVLPGPVPVSCTENPSVVAVAADRLGDTCAPLICTEGQPSAAALALLRRVQAAGGRLRHHGDFDPQGMAILRYLSRHLEISPWRLSAADYVAALTPRQRDWPEDERVETPWDKELGRSMQHYGVRVEEEDVLDELLGDLAS